MAKPKPYQGVAWGIDCDNDLKVVIVVADKHILLHSQEGSNNSAAPWRLGYYPNSAEAQQKAVEMTGSYERLRAGKVGVPVPVVLPEREWATTTQAGAVDDKVIAAITRSLEVSDLTDD